MDSAKPAIIVDGVEYEPVEHEIDPPVSSETHYIEPQGPFDLGTVQLTNLENSEPWWSFLKAPRFWAMVIGALAVYLESKGFSWWGEAERNLFATLATIFIGVSTFDKTVTKLAKN